MTRRMSVAKMVRYADYCRAELAKPDLPEHQRKNYEGRLAIYERETAGRCRLCGRPLEDPVSLERGYGSDCWPKVRAEVMRLMPDEHDDRDRQLDAADDGRYDDVAGVA